MSHAEQPQPGGPRLAETARIEAFSDGVFSIAITLLVLEIKVPPVARGGPTLAAALWHQWPAFAGYVLSFVTIGIMWASHHTMFEHIRKSDHNFRMLNVLFLMFVSFLPYPTALAAQYLGEPTGRRTAVVLYAATFFAIALMWNAVWWYAAWNDRLLGEHVDRLEVRAISRRYAIGPVSYALGVVLAFISPAACLIWLGVLAVFYLLPQRWAATPRSPDGPQRSPPR
jgi:uncharacterized membrane protein